MSKDPIPFRPRRPERHLPPKRGTSGFEEWVWYWKVRVKNPWNLTISGWSEAMLWGNALVAGLGYGLIWGARRGISLIILIGSVASLLMLAWLWFQGLPWIMSRLYFRLPPATRRPPLVEALRGDLIGLSGIFPIALFLAGFNRMVGLWTGTVLASVWLYRAIHLHFDRRQLPALIETAASVGLMLIAAWVLIGGWI